MAKSRQCIQSSRRIFSQQHHRHRHPERWRGRTPAWILVGRDATKLRDQGPSTTTKPGRRCQLHGRVEHYPRGHVLLQEQPGQG